MIRANRFARIALRIARATKFGCLEKGWNRQGVRLQYLAAATTLETCLEHPFTQPIANKLLHSKQQKECNSSSAIASYCVAWTIARTIATAKNYCSDTPCGIHPFSEHPISAGGFRQKQGPGNLTSNPWALFVEVWVVLPKNLKGYFLEMTLELFKLSAYKPWGPKAH